MRALTPAAVSVALLISLAGCGSARPPARPAPSRPAQDEPWIAICLRRMERVKVEEPQLARARIGRAEGHVTLSMPLDTCGEGIHARVGRSSAAAQSDVPWQRFGQPLSGWLRRERGWFGSIDGYYLTYLRDVETVEGALRRAIDDCLAAAAQTPDL